MTQQLRPQFSRAPGADRNRATRFADPGAKVSAPTCCHPLSWSPGWLSAKKKQPGKPCGFSSSCKNSSQPFPVSLVTIALLQHACSAHRLVKETRSIRSLKQCERGDQNKPTNPKNLQQRSWGEMNCGVGRRRQGQRRAGSLLNGLCCGIRCSCNYTLISVIFLKLDHFTDLL